MLTAFAPVDLVLGTLVGLAALLGAATRGRGGRSRGVMGWVGYWLLFALILVALARAPAWVGLTLLGLLMFVLLRAYNFLAPLRPRDRYAHLAAYLVVPFALYPGLTGSEGAFLATVPIVLFLVFPVLLSVGEAQQGMLESMGRILLGILIFVFCAAHLGLLVRFAPKGLPVLFGVMALVAELAQRMIGRPGDGQSGWAGAGGGAVVGAVASAACGFWLGPRVGLIEEDAARAGLLVAVAVWMGALVSSAMVRDLGISPSETRVGRAALLDRAIPALYAAPVYYHYLSHFA